MWVICARRLPLAAHVGCCPAVGRCPGSWGRGSWRCRGHWAVTPGVGHGPQEGWVVGSGCPLRCRRCHWIRIAVLRVCGLLVGLVVLSPRPSSTFVALVPGIRPSCRSAAPCGEVCRNGPCLGRCIPCGWGSVYACTARRLWIDSWFSRCSPCVVTGLVLVSGRRRRPVLCGCSMCVGYTPCGPDPGYAGVLRYLRSGLWHCSRYVVIGFGLVPVRVGVVSLPPVLSPPPRGSGVSAVPGS